MIEQRIVLLALLATLLASCASATGSAPPAAGPATQLIIAPESKLIGESGPAEIPQVGQVAPDFQYTMPDGTTHKLSDLRGKKVLVNFWATWCGPCRSEMPDLQKVLGETGDSVAVLGVNKAQELKELAPFAEELRISFPLIANPSGDIAGRYAAQNLPTSYFINSDGTIGLKKTGVMNYSFIKTHLDQLK
ncbi:MAG TPA: TlpA disulfide reductase family protein [Roseiflexaceae bacterium]|nr:TlpA disulfide reductase family protein [Roseiflexaceae bacterium]